MEKKKAASGKDRIWSSHDIFILFSEVQYIILQYDTSIIPSKYGKNGVALVIFYYDIQ